MTEQSTSYWRLIFSPPASGPENMAIDAAILDAVIQGDSPATLRLYRWDPACLSLGSAQPIADVDLDAVESRGWGLVRRPTGGRAILHTDELTYAVIAPTTERLVAGGVLPSYERISAALVEALIRLNIQVEVQPNTHLSESDRSEPVCFEAHSAYEMTAGGKKILGSAQLRRRGGVLQHGSLPLMGDITRICYGLTYRDDNAREHAIERVRSRATTVEELTGSACSWEEAASVMTNGFEKVLNRKLTPGELTPTERGRTKALLQERFQNWGWTGRL